MESESREIDGNYERFYTERSATRVYPTEFVVRTFLAHYPGLHFRKPSPGQTVLDIGFGDGRNTAFLCEQGFAVSGIEITPGIVARAQARLVSLGYQPDLRVGRNSHIPFGSDTFDYILSCHCCYYCDDGESLSDNLAEYARVMNAGGYLVASVACQASYIFDQATRCPDGSMVVRADPYGNRNGYRLHAFRESKDVESYFSPWFTNFSFGFADNNYYGIAEKVFWVVCQKRSG